MLFGALAVALVLLTLQVTLSGVAVLLLLRLVGIGVWPYANPETLRTLREVKRILWRLEGRGGGDLTAGRRAPVGSSQPDKEHVASV